MKIDPATLARIEGDQWSRAVGGLKRRALALGRNPSDADRLERAYIMGKGERQRTVREDRFGTADFDTKLAKCLRAFSKFAYSALRQEEDLARLSDDDFLSAFQERLGREIRRELDGAADDAWGRDGTWVQLDDEGLTTLRSPEQEGDDESDNNTPVDPADAQLIATLVETGAFSDPIPLRTALERSARGGDQRQTTLMQQFRIIFVSAANAYAIGSGPLECLCDAIGEFIATTGSQVIEQRMREPFKFILHDDDAAWICRNAGFAQRLGERGFLRLIELAAQEATQGQTLVTRLRTPERGPSDGRCQARPEEIDALLKQLGVQPAAFREILFASIAQL